MFCASFLYLLKIRGELSNAGIQCHDCSTVEYSLARVCFARGFLSLSFVSPQKRRSETTLSASLFIFPSLSSLLSFYLLCCAQNLDPSCAGRLHCSPEIYGATRKKASSNVVERDVGKSESRKKKRERGCRQKGVAVRLGKETPSGKRSGNDEKKARVIQRNEGRVPCFVWASQRGWSSFIARIDSGSIVCVCVCVCDARACERVQKY